MIEQNVNMALSIAHRGYVLQIGEVVLTGAAQELLENSLIQKAYLVRADVTAPIRTQTLRLA